MSFVMRSNGLQHAASLGTIEVSSKPVIRTNSGLERSYDSEDEGVSRRRLRHKSSTDLYPRKSIYSKGDIREQYCLTDRQLSTIERPRRERFFGCLSRQSAPQSFLGVCVGRRAPSDENLSTYNTFYKYPSYQYMHGAKIPHSKMDSSYFGRKPASILSSKMTNETDIDALKNLQPIHNIKSENINFSNEQREKHVSFARSHTLTSFNDVNYGFRSSGRLRTARSQERLIGGKKALSSTASVYEGSQVIPIGNVMTQQALSSGTIPHPILMPQISHIRHHQHMHGHSHHHHRGSIHVTQFIPTFNAVNAEQPIALLQPFPKENLSTTGLNLIAPPCSIPPSSPEVVIIEKKFRNAMKTQATQTDLRKDCFSRDLALSPKLNQKVKIKVVSQGAQTNSFQNCKKKENNLSQVYNETTAFENIVEVNIRSDLHHPPLDNSSDFFSQPDTNISYYIPPPPLDEKHDKTLSTSSLHSIATETPQYFSLHHNDFDGTGYYESNSLPRITCNFNRLENDYNSSSLPRPDPLCTKEICKHVTDCSDLLGNLGMVDPLKIHLLPPPIEYCRDNDDSSTFCLQFDTHELADKNRRGSMVTYSNEDDNCPFRRDDFRRQSMPTYVKSSTKIEDCSSNTLPRSFGKSQILDEEKEILINFKPYSSPKRNLKIKQKYNEDNNVKISYKILNKTNKIEKEDQFDQEIESSITKVAVSDEEDEEFDQEDPLYENLQAACSCNMNDKGNNEHVWQYRSTSLDDATLKPEDIGISEPPSPCREELLANASTYPSSDSLANDITRDHSDGIWNESQVTVVRAEQRDISLNSYSSNLLLTPSSRRKNLLLQHQQRSSIDTDGLELEEPVTDFEGTPSINIFQSMAKSLPPLQETNRLKMEPSDEIKIMTPSISVTSSPSNQQKQQKTISLLKSPNASPKQSKDLTVFQSETRKTDAVPQQKNTVSLNNHFDRTDVLRFNNDISECSTNTDEYATCTDTSKRTPGTKTPTTTTSSSSTTQVPVSTQSSQMEKTPGGSSFESASSLYSTRGEVLLEDTIKIDYKLNVKTDINLAPISKEILPETLKKSPSHSISSTSSGSYLMGDLQKQNSGNVTQHSVKQQQTELEKETPKPKSESVSDDDQSELRYSSSGYYESPHDEDIIMKSRRHRVDEDRKRRKTSMKLDIEKENIRALTSPVKKIHPQPQNPSSFPSNEENCNKQTLQNITDFESPNKTKRFRPKIRRQLRKVSRDESNSKRQTNFFNIYTLTPEGTEKLLDSSMKLEQKSKCPLETSNECISNNFTQLSPINVKFSSESCQLKAKSTESLRSVSPGSDSVFYSEADGMTNDHQGHCLHCGKEMESQNLFKEDSVESLPFIEHERANVQEDIVKPPSDFADSPITTKTTQRLYKKMDKRFRSEERYHGDRGRHFKTRQENIRAKSEERSRENNLRSPLILRPAGSSPSVLPAVNNENSKNIIYRGHYDTNRYIRLTDADIWTQLNHQNFDHQRERSASTESEHCFRSKYQVILHRLVQRRCTLEMYYRQKHNRFRVDKTIIVKSDSGEFGFRIHGSKPVVVAAIEPETPAESSGLEVGDIIISVNGIQVLDKHHTEVVKIAHDGCEKLELQVARTIGVLMNEQQEPPVKPVISGYLWRQSGQAKGNPNTNKWVRRWFCLRPDNCLYYYKTENDTQPVGAMILTKHSIEHCQKDIGKPHAFKIDSGEGIPLFVAADSEELTTHWINTLKKASVFDNPWLDTFGRNLYQSPASILRPDCFGYLMKLGSRWCGWSKRYCVLKDACLYFYQDANSKAAFGMACLHGYKVVSISTNTSGKKNSFEIIPPELKLRHYFFSAESEMDKKRWISALEYSIDRWIKSG